MFPESRSFAETKKILGSSTFPVSGSSTIRRKSVISDFWVMTHDLYAKLAQESDSQVKNCISTTPGHLVTTDRPQKAKNALKLEET